MTRKRTGGGKNRERSSGGYRRRLDARGLGKAPKMTPFATEAERDRLRRRQDLGEQEQER